MVTKEPIVTGTMSFPKSFCPLLALTAALVWTGPVRAEHLDEAWTAALSVDQRLEAARDRVRSAQCSHAAASAGYWPNVTNLTGYTFLSDNPAVSFDVPGLPFPVSGSIPLVDRDFVANSTLVRQPLYTFGRISGGVSAAGSQIHAAREEEARTVLDVKLEVAGAYVGVLRAQHAVEVARSSVSSLEAHVRDVQNLLEQGLVARNALLAAQVSLADARQKLLQAANGLDAARAGYNRLVGRPMTEPVELEELRVPPAEDDLESLTARAAANRPELAQLAAQANALRWKAQSVRAEQYPQAGAVGGFTFLENRHLDPEGIWSLTFGLEWRPFDGGMTRAKANALLHDASALARLRQDALSTIALQVRRTWLDEQETRRRIEVTGKAIDQAEENLRVARNRFKGGEASYTEVLDAETLRNVSYQNYYNAVYDAVLATFRLRRAVGDL